MYELLLNSKRWIMPKITATLKELRNAEVRFISLVDRAATRIPFRVLKKDETEMDLSKIFKSEPAPKAEVVAIGVFNHQDAQMAEAVKQAIADAGFSVDKVVKSEDGETLSYVQKDEEGDTFVKLSDQVVVVTKGFYGMPGNGTFAEMLVTYDFPALCNLRHPTY
jgi:hypothetical protein